MIALRREALAGAGRAVRLLELPHFVRSSRGSYWHIPRSAERWDDGRVSVSAWCGIGVGSSRTSPAVFTDVAPVENVCGTCSGRFDGATADGRLIFSPRDDFASPTWCPCPDFDDVGNCVACGARVRASTWWGGGLARHRPGPEFAARCVPCPDHGFTRIGGRGGRVVCWAQVGWDWGNCEFDCGPRGVR